MAKLIVTHINPDLDAIAAVWLLQRFDRDFADASVVFVPAGDTYEGKAADVDPNIVHVDTGLGELDHHQTNEFTCAAELVFNRLKPKFKHLKSDEALLRLIKVVKEIDHFHNVFWPEAISDRFQFFMGDILAGLKFAGKADDEKLIYFGKLMLDGVYQSLKIKLEAEETIEKGREFKTSWGKGIACETGNNAVMKLGLKRGYKIVVRKDEDLGILRISTQPVEQMDLTAIAQKIRKKDPGASWYLHSSKKMFFNGSSHSPEFKKTKLKLNEVVEILRAT